MDGVEAIGKALTWVFEEFTVGLPKLIEYLGFLFQWGDILKTADSIVAIVNAGFDYGQDQITRLKAQVTKFINDLKAAVASPQTPVQTAAGSETKNPKETPTMDTLKNSVAYNWSSYQVSCGGMADIGQIKNSANAIKTGLEAAGRPESGDATLADLWTDMSKIFQTVKYLVQDIGKDVQDLFTPGTTSTSVFERLTNQLINAALDTTSNVADFLLDALSLVLSAFKSLGNEIIELPILTSLWKFIAGGRDLTVFNVFALILAIPTTIVYKAVKGTAPPDLSGMN